MGLPGAVAVRWHAKSRAAAPSPGVRPRGIPMTYGYSPLQGYVAGESKRLAGKDFTDPDRDAGEDHFSHVTGKTCLICGGAIAAGQPARRRGESDWAHDVCPITD